SACRARNAHQSSATPSKNSDIAQRMCDLISSPRKEGSRELTNFVVDGRQLRRIREEDDAEEAIFRRRAKTGSVNAEHARRAKEREHVVLVGDARRKVHLRHRVERGRWRDSGHTVNSV